jgi:2-hydroxychromene-2-carboxylate isomerase
MSVAFDFYFSFRSPYSYLATPQIAELVARYDAAPNVHIVLPIALRIPGFFKRVNPLWPPYLMRDTVRIAQMHGIPYSWPHPDPIIMDLASGEVAVDQPYIHRVSRLGVAATEKGRGLPFIVSAARAIWSGEIRNWHQGDHLKRAADEAGLNLAELDAAIAADPARYDREIEANAAAQQAAGHWGVPLFVFQGEAFFGQDRIDHLLWRMKQHGLTERG